MISAEIPKNELERLEALHSYNVLDTLSEEEFDSITKLAAQICNAPICLISLVDETRQFFKSHHGISATETHRDFAFCAHAINNPNKPFIVNNSLEDERFHDNPLVTGDPKVIFYAGIPLVDSNGLALGTLCAIDNHPREISQAQIDGLTVLSKAVMNTLELRRNNLNLNKSILQFEKIIELTNPFYLILKDSLIVKFSASMLKSNNNLKVNSSFEDNFSFEDNNLNLESISFEENQFTIINSLDKTLQYKIIAVKFQNHVFIIAAPVFNSKHKIENYKLTLDDFPLQDYLSEYLMLQNSAVKSVKDAKLMMSLIVIKNNQLKNQLKKINDLSMYLIASPNGLIVYNLKFDTIYENLIAKKFLADHNSKELKDYFKKISEKHQFLKENGINTTNVIYNFKEKTFSINLSYKENLNEILLYITDISYYVDEIEIKSNLIIEMNNSLEKRIQKEVEANVILRNTIAKKEILAVIGDLTAGFAHDLNTPLSSILHGSNSLKSDFERFLTSVIWKISKDDYFIVVDLMDNLVDEFNILGGLEKINRKKIFHTYFEQNQIDINSTIISKLVDAGITLNNIEFIRNNYEKNNFENLLDAVIVCNSMKSLMSLIIESAKKGVSSIVQMKQVLSNNLSDSKTKIVLHDSINNAVLLFRFELKRITSCSMDIDPSIIVHASESDLFQIWSNLIKNAIEALSENDSGQDKTLKIYSEINKSSVKIIFENNGPMIPLENQGLIFDQYYTTKREKGGTGLGMSILKKMAIHNEIKVELESNLQATKFTLIFSK